VSEPFIICDNLVKIYQVAGRDIVALQGLDLVVNRCELMGIVGVSGSGKSTLMNILGGLDRPTAGRAWVDGKDLLKLSDAQLDNYRLTKVGFVWQQSSRNLVSYLNAQQNVELPLKLSGMVGRPRQQRAAELLNIVGLDSRRKHHLSELSGGEQQRVGIAVALANNPTLLLADEPTGEVDQSTAASLYDLFRTLNNDLGLTTLIVSHDPNLAHHVDRVISIRDGKISTETKVIDLTVNIDALLIGEAGVEEAESETTPQATPGQQIVQELIVVDSAGRLQVPKEYLEQYSIRGRVELEPVDQGILIRPVAEHAGLAASGHESAESLIDRLEENRRLHRPGARLTHAIQQVAARFKRTGHNQNIPDGTDER
jgi:ABC-type lipoprotein export system ATPase subunit